MKINQAGFDLIKSFEGCKLQAYQDVVGIWTIGYGHTGPEVVPGLVITQEKAESYLLENIAEFERQLNKILKVEVNENQYSALISFLYNLGISNLKRSTLLKLINQGNANKAADSFLPWDVAGGVIVPGLKRRREAERALFLTPV